MSIRRRMRLARALVLALGVPAAAVGQEPRLEGRVPEPARAEIETILSRARSDGVPTEPLVDRALEGASKGADGERILQAVRRLDGELRTARDALGPASSSVEIAAGASALRAGARPTDLQELRRRRMEQSVTVAAAVLADLVAVGVPVDTAVSAVLVLAGSAEDAEYVAFRQNVERDIALGASPVTALGVRLDMAAEAFGDNAGRAPPQRPRKP